MHRARGGRLALSLLSPQPHTSSSSSRRFRSSLSTKKHAAKTTKRVLEDSALNILRLARSHKGGLIPPKTRRSIELKLVNSILDEHRLPKAAARDVVRPMAPHLEEGISELPRGVGPGALVEVRW
jgi:hypothetical protein